MGGGGRGSPGIAKERERERERSRSDASEIPLKCFVSSRESNIPVWPQWRMTSQIER